MHKNCVFADGLFPNCWESWEQILCRILYVFCQKAHFLGIQLCNPAKKYILQGGFSYDDKK